jgi:predicted RNA-binding Zn-ribbon protein involved in translation (DUF1610 family)
MRISYSGVRAHCPQCGADEFEPLDADLASHAVDIDGKALFACQGCGRHATRWDLIAQLSRRIVDASAAHARLQ